ncbi:MAG: hypothetical protein IT315_11130 [Anaerolineales bacterium]|nr:hypothetical protein [Anaerolineales bacterium]
MNDWSQFPKINSLFQASELENSANYFSLAIQREVLKSEFIQEFYFRLEKELAFLDETAWNQFRQKVLRYITVVDQTRGYQQLFDCFNEIKGYIFLHSQGYKNIEFIAEINSAPTPDLIGKDIDRAALVEVKTINHSDNEIVHIKNNSKGQGMVVRDVLHALPIALTRKIESTIETASKQLLSYNTEVEINRRIVYLYINSDVVLSLDNRNIEALKNFCNGLQSESVEIVSEFN